MKIISSVGDKHEGVMRRLCELCEGDIIEYVDHATRETYYITKNNKKYKISIGGNKIDGGFLGDVKEIKKAEKK